MSTQENKDTVVRLYREAIAGENYDLADELLTPNYVAHPSLPSSPTGPARFRQQMQRMHSVFSDWEVELHSVVAEGDEVAVRATSTFTHVGTFMGIEATGKRVSGRSMVFFRFEGEKVAEVWIMEDPEAIAAQLEG